MCLIPREEKALNTLELELQTAVSYRVRVGSHVCPRKEHLVLLTLEPSLQSPDTIVNDISGTICSVISKKSYKIRPIIY